LSKQIEKAATELSVELVGRRPVVLVRLLQRRRALLGGPAEPSGQSRVTRARGAARVRARNRHEHLPIRKRLARRLHATMPVPPCRPISRTTSARGARLACTVTRSASYAMTHVGSPAASGPAESTIAATTSTARPIVPATTIKLTSLLRALASTSFG